MSENTRSYVQYGTSEEQVENSSIELARRNRFTEADLEENRKGRISNTQMNRLFGRALRPMRYTGSALAGWLLFCFVVNALVPDIVIEIATMVGGKSIWGAIGAITLACLAAFLLSLLRSGHTVALLLRDLSAGRSACLEGRLSISKEDEQGLGMARLHGEKHRKAWFVVKDEYFEASEEECVDLPPGRYRLYYTPRSKLMLSIEPAG